jgi:hypothetical protein
MKTIAKKSILLGLAGCGLFMLIMIGPLIYTLIYNHETSSKTPLTEYNNLFTNKAQGKLQILVTAKSRSRPPVSTYVYDNRFNICVFKVMLTNNSTLRKTINYKNATSYSNLFVVNGGLPSTNFDMKINEGRVDKVSIVDFKFDGDSIKSIVNNDSTRCYYCKFETFSISYNNGSYDILAKADQSTIPASVLFIKKKDSLYIIIMSVAEGKEEMRPDLLISLINR